MASSDSPLSHPARALTLGLVRFGSDTLAARALKELARATPGLCSSWPGALDRLADAVGMPPAERPGRFRQAEARARRAMDRAARAGIALLPWFHLRYPPLLREIPDPPVVLWCAGQCARLSTSAVAIVGSRRATPAGLIVARRLARGLAEAGLTVVSGLARGIDAAAHDAALEAGGTSIAVLGSGVDVVYPREHAALAARLRAAGALVGEFPPGTPPLPHHFPLRNRIISGLSRAVVVVEASQRSGSLITARAALEQGRDVLAVPGSVASGQHAGCHGLIKDGAALVETVDDVLEALGWSGARPGLAGGSSKAAQTSVLEQAMAIGEPYTLDDLAARTGLPAAVLLAELGALEIDGIVGRAGSAGFVRFDKSAIGGGSG